MHRAFQPGFFRHFANLDLLSASCVLSAATFCLLLQEGDTGVETQGKLKEVAPAGGEKKTTRAKHAVKGGCAA